MRRVPFLGYVVLPTLAFGGYFACLHFAPHFAKTYLHTEHGAIEWGTALGFLVAACFAARLIFKTRKSVPNRYRAFYVLFAVAAVFVSLEELSYGQKLFKWSSPDWFAERNAKSETNLHNMYGNRPSNWLRAIATVGCPMCCLVLPAWFRLRRIAVKADSWMYYLLPGIELGTIALLTLILTVFNKIPSIKGMATWTGHLGELKELYWAVAAACYADILSRRLLSRYGAADDESPHHAPSPERRAA